MDYNPYAMFFRSLKEINVAENTEIRLTRDLVLDQRVYNAPATKEVVVIWSEESASSQNDSPHIVVRGHSQTIGLCTIMDAMILCTTHFVSRTANVASTMAWKRCPRSVESKLTILQILFQHKMFMMQRIS